MTKQPQTNAPQVTQSTIRDMTSIMRGFSQMFANMAEQMQSMLDTIDNPTDSTDKQDTVMKNAASTFAQEDELPWENAKESTPPEEQTDTVTISQEDLTKVIVSKIKQNRSNNTRIGKLLASYGIKQLSELPKEKYEEFLTEVSAF